MLEDLASSANSSTSADCALVGGRSVVPLDPSRVCQPHPDSFGEAGLCGGPAQRGYANRSDVGHSSVLALVIVRWLLRSTPTEFGFFRTRWSCALLAFLLREQEDIHLSPETIRRGMDQMRNRK
jgi:hypothetical protein